MAVNFPEIQAAQLQPIAGVTLGQACANIGPYLRPDLLVMALDARAAVSAVFTLNRFCAAPVLVSRAHLQHARHSGSGIRALVVTVGNANAGMGQLGLRHAHEICQALARTADIQPEQVLPFATGIILEPLPLPRVLAALPVAWAARGATHWLAAAETIMTTDTQAKAASKRVMIAGHPVTLTGISKGAGMIKPNMATMLAFIATDAQIAQPVLDTLVKIVADQSFNCITVDGECSTNDALVIIASGQSPVSVTSTTEPAYAEIRDALIALAQTLAQLIVRDAEGATKFITVEVNQGQNVEECRKIGYAIGQSLLVKTAFFASDPNLGRLLSAIGAAGVALDTQALKLYLNDVLVIAEGGRHPAYQEAQGARAMQPSDITVRVDLARGESSGVIWTCDLSYDYVRINASYRS